MKITDVEYNSIVFDVTFLSPDAEISTDPVTGGQVITITQDYTSDDYFAEDYVGTST